MSSRLLRIILNSKQPENLVRFYTVLGFQFEKKSVDKGSTVWLGKSPQLYLEIFGIQESFSEKSPNVQLAFEVNDVKALIQQAKDLGAQIMVDPMNVKNGIMGIAMDPDGRSVELFQPQNLP